MLKSNINRTEMREKGSSLDEDGYKRRMKIGKTKNALAVGRLPKKWLSKT
jgi:hypothetical protein